MYIVYANSHPERTITRESIMRKQSHVAKNPELLCKATVQCTQSTSNDKKTLFVLRIAAAVVIAIRSPTAIQKVKQKGSPIDF